MNRPAHRTRCHAIRPPLLAVLSLAILAVNVGCANGPTTSPKTEPLAEAPGWVTRGCRVYWQDQNIEANAVCGIGTAGPDRNPLAARETAIARARSAIARSIEVTIESLVRVETTRDVANDGDLRSIIHQLTSTSLPASRVESVWTAGSGEVFALVSLRVAKVQQSLRQSHKLLPAAREELAQRAADAFAELDAAPGRESEEDGSGAGQEIEE